MLSIIVAAANNNAIGKNNSLLWHLPNDLKRFKEITIGKTIIMGRKTFQSLPYILPNRHHIILTRDDTYASNDERVTIIHNLKELEPYIGDDKEHFVIGGGEIYNLLFPYVNKLYITKINEEFDGDTFFPSYDEDQWDLIHEEAGIINENNSLDHKFIVLKRKFNFH